MFHANLMCTVAQLGRQTMAVWKLKKKRVIESGSLTRLFTSHSLIIAQKH